MVEVKLNPKVAHLYGHDRDLINQVLHLNDGDVFLDIGCGPGTWSLAAAAHGARVFAFDPRPLALSLLAEQVALNGYRRVALFPYAVWAYAGQIPFSDSSAFWGKMEGLEVTAVSIDEILADFGRPPVKFINVDAEGAEMVVLDGARVTIANCRPNMVIEVHKNVPVQEILDKVRTMLPGHDVAMHGDHLVALRPE